MTRGRRVCGLPSSIRTPVRLPDEEQAGSSDLKGIVVTPSTITLAAIRRAPQTPEDSGKGHVPPKLASRAQSAGSRAQGVPTWTTLSCSCRWSRKIDDCEFYIVEGEAPAAAPAMPRSIFRPSAAQGQDRTSSARAWIECRFARIGALIAPSARHRPTMVLRSEQASLPPRDSDDGLRLRRQPYSHVLLPSSTATARAHRQRHLSRATSVVGSKRVRNPYVR